MSELTQLKKLVLDDRFINLKSMVNQEINLMSILNIAHKELQHSNFLAWLFDPSESHNKGEYFIKEFIKLYYRENAYADLGGEYALSVFDFVKLDLSDVVIQREHKNIDLLVSSESNKMIICIENKIFSGEREGQLTKYRKYVERKFNHYKYRVYIYLSLLEQEVSEEESQYYIPITYDHIITMLTLAIENAQLSDNVVFIVNQYITTLKVIMNDNSEIERIAQDLYKDYKSSFDLVFKYVTPSSTRGGKDRVPNNLRQYILDEPSLIATASNVVYIRFVPKELAEFKSVLVNKGIVTDDFDFTNQSLFTFVFIVKYDMIRFAFSIGEYDDAEVRKRLFNHCIKKPELFSSLKKLSAKWNRSVSFKILDKNTYAKLQGDQDKLDAHLKTEFDKVVNEVVPSILDHIKTI